MNGSYGSVKYNKQTHQTIKYLKELKPSIVLTTGDMVAGQKSGLDYQAMWNSFNQSILFKLNKSGIPIAHTPGNHDASGYKSFKKEREVFQNNFSRYKQKLNYVDDSNYPFYYSYFIDNTFFHFLGYYNNLRSVDNSKKMAGKAIRTSAGL